MVPIIIDGSQYTVILVKGNDVSGLLQFKLRKWPLLTTGDSKFLSFLS